MITETAKLFGNVEILINDSTGRTKSRLRKA